MELQHLHLTSGVTAGIATIYASLDNQALNTYVTVKDTIPPKVFKNLSNE